MVRPVPGARVVYRPVAQSYQQEQTEAYAAALFASEAEQARVNDEFLRAHPEAARAVSGAPAVSGARTMPSAAASRPSAASGAPAVSASPPAPPPTLAAPPRPVAVSSPASTPRPAPVADASEAGAAAARSLIGVSPPRPSEDATFEAGAAAARSLICSNGLAVHRQASPFAATPAHSSTEHDAGAAEARRLLGRS